MSSFYIALLKFTLSNSPRKPLPSASRVYCTLPRVGLTHIFHLHTSLSLESFQRIATNFLVLWDPWPLECKSHGFATLELECSDFRCSKEGTALTDPTAVPRSCHLLTQCWDSDLHACQAGTLWISLLPSCQLLLYYLPWESRRCAPVTILTVGMKDPKLRELESIVP